MRTFSLHMFVYHILHDRNIESVVELSNHNKTDMSMTEGLAPIMLLCQHKCQSTINAILYKVTNKMKQTPLIEITKIRKYLIYEFC